MSENEKVKKYLVLKLDDIETGLWSEAKETFWNMVNTISVQRHKQGKKDNEYIVVNEDEPYAEDVWDLVLGKVAPRGGESRAFKPYRKKPVVIQAKQMAEPFTVETLEGTMKGKAGDFLIIGVRGERYPCDKDIFEQTYEVVQ